MGVAVWDEPVRFLESGDRHVDLSSVPGMRVKERAATPPAEAPCGTAFTRVGSRISAHDADALAGKACPGDDSRPMSPAAVGAVAMGNEARLPINFEAYRAAKTGTLADVWQSNPLSPAKTTGTTAATHGRVKM